MSNPFDQFATEVRAAVPDVAAPPPMDASPFGDPAAPVPTSVMNPPPQANGYGGYGAPQQQPPMGQAPNPYGAPQGGYGMPPHSDPPPMANGGDFGSPARAPPPMSSFSSPPLAAPSDPFGGGAYGGYSQPPAPVPGASPPFQMPESAPAPEAAPPSPGGNPFGAPIPHQNGRMPLSPGADNPFGASPMQPKGAPPMPPQGAPPIPPMGAPPMPSQGAPPPPQQNPYGADPSQNPYGDDPSQQNPYGGNSAQQNLYGADPAQQYLYGADPAQQNPYGADPSQQSPFGAPSFQQNPYGTDPSLGGQGAQPAQQQYGADPWGAQSGPGAIVPSYQPADPMAGALVPSQQQPQQQYGNVDPFSVFATSPAPAPEPAFLAIAPAPAPVPQQQPPAQTEDDLWADMGFDKPVPDPPKADESAPATESKGGEASNATPGELPPGGEWYDARIFTPTLGVMFFKPQELTDSLFLQTDKSIVDALEERPVVAFIVEGSSARSAGVELGHVLLKVNGIDVKNPKEASRLIKEGPRPLPLLFYVPDTNVVVAEGEHMVKYDTRETTAPNSAKDWKPKYVVIGGIIAQPWMMNMYRSKVSIICWRLTLEFVIATFEDSRNPLLSSPYSPSMILQLLRRKRGVLYQ